MDTINSLLSNRWVLYGGAALAVLGVVFYARGSSTVEDEASDGGFLSSPLYPIGAGAAIGVPSPGTTNASGGLGDLGALISLESQKAEYGREISLAEIDASLKSNLASVNANVAIAGLQSDALTMAAFASVYTDAAKLLNNPKNTTVAGNFAFGDKTFSFSAVKPHSSAALQANSLNFVNAYQQVTQGNIGSGQSYVASNPSAFGSVSLASGNVAPTSTNPSGQSRTKTAAAPVARGGSRTNTSGLFQ